MRGRQVRSLLRSPRVQGSGERLEFAWSPCWEEPSQANRARGPGLGCSWRTLARCTWPPPFSWPWWPCDHDVVAFFPPEIPEDAAQGLGHTSERSVQAKLPDPTFFCPLTEHFDFLASSCLWSREASRVHLKSLPAVSSNSWPGPGNILQGPVPMSGPTHRATFPLRAYKVADTMLAFKT